MNSSDVQLKSVFWLQNQHKDIKDRVWCKSSARYNRPTDWRREQRLGMIQSGLCSKVHYRVISETLEAVGIDPTTSPLTCSVSAESCFLSVTRMLQRSVFMPPSAPCLTYWAPHYILTAYSTVCTILIFAGYCFSGFILLWAAPPFLLCIALWDNTVHQ